jgi:hypothetical protein
LASDGTIAPAEFSAFEDVRKVRNKLVHGSFRDGLTQDQIEDLRNTLRKKILTAYRTSKLLDHEVFKKYAIQRLPRIALEP